MRGRRHFCTLSDFVGAGARTVVLVLDTPTRVECTLRDDDGSWFFAVDTPALDLRDTSTRILLCLD